jgi:hypothetical protein
MKHDLPARRTDRIEECIYTVRGQRVMLDADLARLYGVTTKRLNEQVKRNRERFPDDFLFQLTQEEALELWCSRSQIATLKRGQNIKYLPYAFTEHGAIMGASVLNSPPPRCHSELVETAAGRLSCDGKSPSSQTRYRMELKDRLNLQAESDETPLSFAANAVIVDILRRFMDIIDPPALPVPPKKGIGFHVKESRARYRIRRKEARR